MASGSILRFDAQSFGRLSTVNQDRRFEMEFVDAQGEKTMVSLPVAAAVEMACLICDASEHAPYLVGGVHRGEGGQAAGGEAGLKRRTRSPRSS